MKTVIEEHAQMVADLCKAPDEIVADFKNAPAKAHLAHMAMLLTSEAGELCDAIKKHVIYGKDLDMKNVVEELGDIEFALEGIRRVLFITRHTTLEHNIIKLRDRYKAGKFSNAAAIKREDKAEEPLPTRVKSDSVDQCDTCLRRPDVGEPVWLHLNKTSISGQPIMRCFLCMRVSNGGNWIKYKLVDK